MQGYCDNMAAAHPNLKCRNLKCRGYYDSTEATSSDNDAGVCCWPMPTFMGQTGHRTSSEYGHIFKTVSTLDSQGNEREPEYCCQEHAGMCTEGVAEANLARFVRCYASSAQQGACTYARGPFAVTDVQEVPCDNNKTNCDEKMNLVFRPPKDTGGHEILEYSIETAQYAWNGSCYCTPVRFYPIFPRSGQPINETVVTGLTNFLPYYFKVSAVTTLGFFSNFGPARYRTWHIAHVHPRFSSMLFVNACTFVLLYA